MYVVGIDEVGRGCWAGPVVAGAVVLPENFLHELRDSKLLRPGQRDAMAGLIHEGAAATGLGWVWPDRIDEIGLTASVAEAMRSALASITCSYDDVVIDGNYNFLPECPEARTMVKADSLLPAVSAASIIAKVARDTYMQTIAATKYPEYGFERHVGYGTKQHKDALANHGVTDIHRRSYKPIQQMLLQSNHERTTNGYL